MKRVMVIFVLKMVNIRWIFTITLKIKIGSMIFHSFHQTVHLSCKDGHFWGGTSEILLTKFLILADSIIKRNIIDYILNINWFYYKWCYFPANIIMWFYFPAQRIMWFYSIVSWTVFFLTRFPSFSRRKMRPKFFFEYFLHW